MDTLNFELNNNQLDAETILKDKGYNKIGHKKDNCKGICVFINRKQYFELSDLNNDNIFKTDNISDLKLYC